jgi:hypothetical protein
MKLTPFKSLWLWQGGLLFALLIPPCLSTAKAEQKQQAPGEAVAVLLAPFVFSSNPNLGNGCWIRAFDEPQYAGPRHTLIGPLSLRKIEAPGLKWRGEIQSLIIGPKATAIVYSDENFKEKQATLAPGTKTPDIQKFPFIGDNIESLKIMCSEDSHTKY